MRDVPPAPLSSARLVVLTLALAAPAALLSAPPAAAQSSGNQRALDSLGPTHGAHRTPVHGHHAAHHARATHAAEAAPKAKPVAVTPPPPIPAAPPPPPVFKAPIINVPLHPEPPPPPVPVVKTAAGAVSTMKDGSRITFGSGSADLNAATMAELQKFAAELKEDPQSRAEIEAYASGTADDPSTPRRMSLSRGLAARAVLINAGIPSTRIYVRAIGQPHDSGPADRVDLTSPEGAKQPAAPVAAPVSESSVADSTGPSAAGSGASGSSSSGPSSSGPSSSGKAAAPP